MIRSTGLDYFSQTGGGRVTATELGGDESYYQVEVTRADGRQVDVHLDKDFKVFSSKVDDRKWPGFDAIEGHRLGWSRPRWRQERVCPAYGN